LAQFVYYIDTDIDIIILILRISDRNWRRRLRSQELDKIYAELETKIKTDTANC